MDFLRDVDEREAFYTYDHSYARNLRELLNRIKSLSSEGFAFHVSPSHDDFRKWIALVVGDLCLARRLEGVNNPLRYAEIIEKRIRELERIRSIKSRLKSIKVYVLQWSRQGWLAALMLLLVLLLISQLWLSEGQRRLIARQDKLEDSLFAFFQREAASNTLFYRMLTGIQEGLMLSQQSQKSGSLILNPIPSPPKDRISKEDIIVGERGVLIRVEHPQWAEIADTGSMLPAMGVGSHVIGIVPKQPSDIIVGDIVSFTSEDGQLLIHRVIETGVDENGWYAITRGDSNPANDPEKLRFDKIKRVAVAIIY